MVVVTLLSVIAFLMLSSGAVLLAIALKLEHAEQAEVKEEFKFTFDPNTSSLETTATAASHLPPAYSALHTKQPGLRRGPSHHAGSLATPLYCVPKTFLFETL